MLPFVRPVFAIGWLPAASTADTFTAISGSLTPRVGVVQPNSSGVAEAPSSSRLTRAEPAMYC